MGSRKYPVLTEKAAAREPRKARKPRKSGGKPRVGQTDRTFIDAAVFLNADYGGVDGIACDVSENGIKIMLESPLEPGPVRVKLVGLPTVSGEICWSMARQVGVRLIRPLAPDVLADWIKYHGGRR